MTNFKINIGFLWPCDGLNEQEYWKFLPKDVRWLTARYGAETETEELTERNLEQYASLKILKKAASLFRTIPLHGLACGDHAASFIFGKKHEEKLIKSLQETLNCPVSFPSKSIVNIVKNNEFDKVALISPYTESLTLKFQNYLSEHDISTISALSLNFDEERLVDELSITNLSDKIFAFIQNCAAKPEILIIAGGGVTFSSEIAKLETLLEIPVITAVGALVKNTIEATGKNYSRNGLGILLQQQKSKTAENVIKEKLSTGTKNFSLTDAPPIFKTGIGPVLYDEDNKSFLDFACGSGTTSLGHGNEDIIKAVKEQLDSGIFHIGPHFQTDSQAEFYSALSDLLPPTLSRFHPSISGSEATEVAIKSSMHRTGAKKFIGFTGGYHGRTFGALSVSGEKGKNAKLGPFYPKCEIIPFPQSKDCIKDSISSLDKEPLAGVIIEPIQATAGLRFVDKDALGELRAYTKSNNIPLIFDETFTGFFRTGKMFSFEHYDLVPDILIFGKAISAGFPAGLVVSTEEILAQWQKGVQSSTFQLGPIAAAASKSFISKLKNGDLAKNAKSQSLTFKTELKSLKLNRELVDVRGIGSFWVLEFNSQETNMKVRKKALGNGLITWECGERGECLGLVPPLNADLRIIEKACRIITKSVSEVLQL